MEPQNFHAIIMPTETCNLACSYCYVLKKPKTRMSIALARQIVDELMRINNPSKPTRLIWHGGEPMLAGLPFYKSICSYIHETYPNYCVEHLIQTNGTLLKDEWIDFFLSEDFKVGVSLDGWQELHDACRTTVAGRGSFDVVFENVQNARTKGLITGFICVLTKNSISFVQELYDFFYKNKFDFYFHSITCLTSEIENQLAITVSEFADASNKFFDLGFFQPEPRVTSVNPTLHYLRSLLLGSASGYCVMAETCADEYFSVEPDGQVSACDRFAGNKQLSFGNIDESSFEEISKSPVRQEFLDRWRRLSEGECKDCEWSAVCHGGCPHEAYAKYGSILGRDPNCEAYKKIFRHISDVVAIELKKVQKVTS
jgi:uncharacterized protein